MSDQLPELLDPRRAVALESRFEGQVPLSQMTRLRPLIESAEAIATYRLDCGKDLRGYSVISGQVGAVLELRCQRCNGLLSLPVESELALALVEGVDEASALPDDYDPLLFDGQLLRSTELVEDELILCVPAVPRHAEGSCEPPFPEYFAHEGDSSDTASQVNTTRPSPFAELRDIKRDLKH